MNSAQMNCDSVSRHNADEASGSRENCKSAFVLGVRRGQLFDGIELVIDGGYTAR